MNQRTGHKDSCTCFRCLTEPDWTRSVCKKCNEEKPKHIVGADQICIWCRGMIAEERDMVKYG